MDAKNLMLGDWVQIETVNARVIRLHEHFVDTLTERGTEIHSTYNDINPIQLTEDILVPYKDCDPDNNIPNSYIFGGYIGMIWDENGLDCGIAIIHYVHELQHALRLCGLSELADSFKIK